MKVGTISNVANTTSVENVKNIAVNPIEQEKKQQRVEEKELEKLPVQTSDSAVEKTSQTEESSKQIQPKAVSNGGDELYVSTNAEQLSKVSRENNNQKVVMASEDGIVLEKDEEEVTNLAGMTQAQLSQYYEQGKISRNEYDKKIEEKQELKEAAGMAVQKDDERHAVEEKETTKKLNKKDQDKKNNIQEQKDDEAEEKEVEANKADSASTPVNNAKADKNSVKEQLEASKEQAKTMSEMLEKQNDANLKDMAFDQALKNDRFDVVNSIMNGKQ